MSGWRSTSRPRSAVDSRLRVLLVGSGAREHAIAWKLTQSPRLGELLTAPGNAGTAQLGTNIPVAATDLPGIVHLARQRSVDFTVVGPEAPLAAGLVDALAEAGMKAFGPTQAAARIESSKAFAKDLMIASGVPTGRASRHSDYEDALRRLDEVGAPIVVKGDGLAEGKAVLVAETRQEAEKALRDWIVEGKFGESGRVVLLEEYLEGTEISVFAFVDGRNISSLVAACDYKLSGDGDTGLNTGGMGSYSPPVAELWNAEMDDRVRREIIEPTVSALSAAGAPYVGALYAGLMITRDGPKVIEFNSRLGDPETQVILPRLKSDLLEVLWAAASGDVGAVPLEWDERACVGVAIASGGYPAAYETGYPINGLDSVDIGAMVFHAGTKESADGVVVTNGGRVLTVAALGSTVAEARARAYENAARISFTGSYYRTDIADVGGSS